MRRRAAEEYCSAIKQGGGGEAAAYREAEPASEKSFFIKQLTMDKVKRDYVSESYTIFRAL
jgi:hypothetical protein